MTVRFSALLSLSDLWQGVVVVQSVTEWRERETSLISIAFHSDDIYQISSV